MNCNFFNQEGIVAAIDDKEVTIVINLCSSCHSNEDCKIGQKRIIKTKNDKKLDVGDKVLVSINKNFGLKSIYYCYVLPFLAMIVAMFVAFLLFNQEVVSAISAVLSLICYYIFLYFWGKIKNYNPNFIVEIIED